MTKRKVIQPDLIDLLLADYQKPEGLLGAHGILKQLTKAIVERALQAELAIHLGHHKHEAVANDSGNTRDGSSAKTLKGDFGALPIEIPRDRNGSFEPQLIAKHQTRWSGFDDKILSLYARGMTVREIQSPLEEMYGAAISPTLISSVTDAVMDEVKAWQVRPLDALYPIDYLDCIHAKVRDDGTVRVKAVYLALGVNLNGEKELLGLWVAQTEGAKFWLQVVKVVTELKKRGVQDIFIACCLAEFDVKWGADYPSIVQSWRRNWPRIIPFFDYPAEIRKVLYTTNAIESVNMRLRKVTKSRGSFPNDDALIKLYYLVKLYYLALRNISKKWTMPIQNWKAALNRFTILFGERMPQH